MGEVYRRTKYAHAPEKNSVALDVVSLRVLTSRPIWKFILPIYWIIVDSFIHIITSLVASVINFS